LLLEWQAVGARVVCAQALHFLAASPGATAAVAAASGGPFDLVFLDPPFGSGQLPAALAALAHGWLAPDCRIYVEHARGEPLPALPAPWQELRAGSAGEVRYHLLVAAAGTESAGATSE
ncbi:MAG: RsmD family RNA methyltransferase, partial [Steroidobacteraceae bacterium]